MGQILNPKTNVSRKYRKRFLLQVIGMLQDSDDSVRASACRAASQLVHSSQVSYSLLPEMMLEVVYGQVFACEDDGNDNAVANALVAILLLNCKRGLYALKHLQKELGDTLHKSVAAAGLDNASESRRIFEEGEYNSYQERVLENQLICRVLIGANNLQVPDSLQKQLLEVCHESLNLCFKRFVHLMSHVLTVCI